jgi:hypothetical protein
VWTLIKGWPDDVVIKTKAPEAIRPNIWGDDLIDHQTALGILIEGFAKDPDALQAIAALIRDDHKF